MTFRRLTTVLSLYMLICVALAVGCAGTKTPDVTAAPELEQPVEQVAVTCVSYPQIEEDHRLGNIRFQLMKYAETMHNEGLGHVGITQQMCLVEDEMIASFDNYVTSVCNNTDKLPELSIEDPARFKEIFLRGLTMVLRECHVFNEE